MTVGVYGLGRFGSFWAELLARSVPVCAYSRSTERPTPPGVRRVGEEEVLAQPVIFLCVAISAVEEVLAHMRGRLSRGVIVMDTCSVKTYPVRLMERMLPGDGIDPRHPPHVRTGFRAGRGEGAADDPLPRARCRPGLENWREFFAAMGLTVSVMTPDEHDREAAFTQGVAHYIGRVLSGLGVRASPISTMGYRKLLEIVEQTCNDPWQLFLDLQRYNPHTREMRVRLEESLRAVMAAIDAPASP